MSDTGNEFDGYEIVASDALEEAPDDTERRLGAFPDPDLELCPVVPLGFFKGKVVFAMPEGEIRDEPAAKIGQMLRTDIFACAAGQAFLAYWRDSDDKFQRDLATVWFNRKCREAGIWDFGRTIRSVGVWPGEAGAVVLHKGDQIVVVQRDGKVETLSIAAALKRRTGPLYRLRPAGMSPTAPCSMADGQWARDQLDRWRWEAIGDEGLTGADVVAGWAMAAELGAVAPFRGHTLIDAMPGSGKTTLMIFLHALGSAICGDVITSFTDAGLRGDLSGEARQVLIDEAEGSPDAGGPGPVEQALEVLRRMSTGVGGNRKQSDGQGGTTTQTAVGAVLMAAVNGPKLGPADATRIVQVRLLPLGSPPAPGLPPATLSTDVELATVTERARELAPAVLGRALRGAWRYRDDVAMIKAALVADEESPRSADLVAMLAAGRRLLLFDEPLTPETAAEEVKFWRPLLLQREGQDMVSNPGADCLAHLMSWGSGQHRQDRQQTLGDLLQRWARGEREYDDVLKAHGLKIWEEIPSDAPAIPWLLVANHHPVLERIFARTHWRDWRRTLGYLDALGPEHKTRPTGKQRFGVGVESRALAIPLTPWLGKRNASVPGQRSGEAHDP